ncbi:MAG: glutamyl-tRNA reductase [Bacteroidetes bacterium]|nr:glutamyl-tRNA reductase [Bacteroidota bacterium]MCW5897128.1 glutamyl-tRNA reductase [Bacteroidota bacterium]
MNLLSIGISHNTASLDIRERMWMSNDEVKEALKQLKEKYFNEAMLVSTCNRTELYGLTPDTQVDDAGLKTFLIDFKGASGIVTPNHFYGSLAGGSVSHLFKVAAGVDSMVIGDIQILNQVKEAFNLATETGVMGPVMNRLMQATLHVGKRVRTETSICEGAVSVSYAAVELASKIFAELSKKSALLIGAGETGELTMKHLIGKGIGRIKIANRTREKAEALITSLKAYTIGEVLDYDQISEALRTVDIVITSVNSPAYIVQPDHVRSMMKQRANNPLFIIDISVPRSVDPSCNKVENVFVYDMDSLSAIVDKNIEKRKAELPKVTTIVREETLEFFKWHNSLQVGPTIQELTSAIESIRQLEVERNINRFKPEDRELVEMLTKRIINKILHQPITNLRNGAQNGARGSETVNRIKALRDLFGIEEKDSHGS